MKGLCFKGGNLRGKSLGKKGVEVLYVLLVLNREQYYSLRKDLKQGKVDIVIIGFKVLKQQVAWE